MPLLSTVRSKRGTFLPANPLFRRIIPLFRLRACFQVNNWHRSCFKERNHAGPAAKRKIPCFFRCYQRISPFRAQADALPSAPLAHYIDRAVREGGYGDKWASE
jgi:hypothetical protein